MKLVLKVACGFILGFTFVTIARLAHKRFAKRPHHPSLTGGVLRGGGPASALSGFYGRPSSPLAAQHLGAMHGTHATIPKNKEC